jgi:hypothetical protein
MKTCFYTCTTVAGYIPTIPATPTKLVIRTPASPPQDGSCVDGSCKQRYAFSFKYTWPRVRVRVGPGWRIGAGGGEKGLCILPGSTTGCFYTDLYNPITVYNVDPAAPARNITIDLPDLDAGPPCP